MFSNCIAQSSHVQMIRCMHIRNPDNGSSIMTPLRITLIVLALFATPCVRADEDEPKGGPEVFKHLKYRSIGPAIGGRVSRAVGVPGDPLVYYMATASGGVWKSSDGGFTFKPIFD